MKFTNITDLKVAFILLGAAFLCSIPFIAGYKSIPEEQKKKLIEMNISHTNTKVIKKKKVKKKKPAKPRSFDSIKAVKGAFIPLTKQEIEADDAIKWKTVFSDDYSKNTIGEKWNNALGKWRMYMGSLKTTTLNSASTIMVKNFEFPDSFRISYICKTVKPGISKVPCDMSFFTYCKPPKNAKKRPNVGDAYLFRVATYNNNFCGISRPGAHLVTNRDFKLMTGEEYHVICQKIGTHLMMSINGKKVFHGKEKNPYKFSKEHKFGGFYVYSTYVEFKNFEISIPEK